MTQIPFGDEHLASSQSEEFTAIELLSGDAPRVTTPEIVAAATIAAADLPAFSVVGRDVAGKLVLAEFGSIPAIGITTQPIKMGVADDNVSIFRSGMFSLGALNYDASYDTDEKKRLAFEEAQPTIFIRKIAYQN